MAEVIKYSYQRSRLHPHLFTLYAAMASILMMFAALTSAYLVRQAAGNWHEYSIPGIFYLSTVLLLLSSVTLHVGYRRFLAGDRAAYMSMVLVSFILGFVFIIMQYIGWEQLYLTGVPLKGNPSGSFFYVISGLHAVHVLGGIASLFTAAYHAFVLKFEVTPKRKTRFALVVQYWHFVDLLWLYLFIFLLIAR